MPDDLGDVEYRMPWRVEDMATVGKCAAWMRADIADGRKRTADDGNWLEDSGECMADTWGVLAMGARLSIRAARGQSALGLNLPELCSRLTATIVSS